MYSCKLIAGARYSVSHRVELMVDVVARLQMVLIIPMPEPRIAVRRQRFFFFFFLPMPRARFFDRSKLGTSEMSNSPLP